MVIRMINKELWTDGTYLSLFDNKTIGISDGVGYINTLEEDEVEKLYLALKKLFKGDDKQ